MPDIWITLIESAFTFAGVCVTVLLTSRSSQKQLNKKIDTLMRHDREQYLSILRLTVMSSEIPVSERIIAGDTYVKEGGNGDVKKYYQQMLKEHTR